MKGKIIIRAIKLVVFVALMVWVINRIQFTDTARPWGKGRGEWINCKIERKDSNRLVISLEGRGKLGFLSREERTGEGRKKLVWVREDSGEKWEIRIGFFSRLANMNLLLFFLSAFAYFLCASFAGVRWHWLLKANGFDVTLWEAWRLNWVGVFFNNVVPGLTGGDVVKAYYIAKRTGQKTVPILTVIVDRILGLSALALLALIVVLWNFQRFKALAWGILGVLGMVSVFTVLFLSRRVRRKLKLNEFLKRLPGARILMRIDEALTFYRTKKKALVFWLLASMCNHILSTGFVAILGYAMAYNVGLVEYFALVPVINIASAVPIAPAGWGVGETLYDLAFMQYAGLGPGEGAALSGVSRAMVTVLSLIGGILLLFMKDRVSAKEIEKEMEEEENTGIEAREQITAGEKK